MSAVGDRVYIWVCWWLDGGDQASSLSRSGRANLP